MKKGGDRDMFYDLEEITCGEIHGMYVIPPDPGGP